MFLHFWQINIMDWFCMSEGLCWGYFATAARNTLSQTISRVCELLTSKFYSSEKEKKPLPPSFLGPVPLFPKCLCSLEVHGMFHMCSRVILELLFYQSASLPPFSDSLKLLTTWTARKLSDRRGDGAEPGRDSTSRCQKGKFQKFKSNTLLFQTIQI